MARSIDAWLDEAPDWGNEWEDLQAKNVDLYLHWQSLDTSTPSGKAMFGMLDVLRCRRRRDGGVIRNDGED